MGFISSGTNLTSKAYLTDIGRKYLFNENNERFDSNGNDLFEIKTFSLADPDMNYNSQKKLSAGEIPDISGESEDCIDSIETYEQKNLLVFEGIPSTNVSYTTDKDGNELVISTEDLDSNVNLNIGI